MMTTSPINENTLELTIFSVADLLCGVDNKDVQEIDSNPKITTVYHAPDYVRGVINLRGDIVTIIDLRLKFGHEPTQINSMSRIVVIKTENENIGLLVDSVEDTIEASLQDVDQPPSNIDGITGSYFIGIYKLEDSLVGILDINELIKK